MNHAILLSIMLYPIKLQKIHYTVIICSSNAAKYLLCPKYFNRMQLDVQWIIDTVPAWNNQFANFKGGAQFGLKTSNTDFLVTSHTKQKISLQVRDIKTRQRKKSCLENFSNVIWENWLISHFCLGLQYVHDITANQVQFI